MKKRYGRQKANDSRPELSGLSRTKVHESWLLSSKARLPPAHATGPWRAGVILGSPPSVKLSQTARWKRGIIPTLHECPPTGGSHAACDRACGRTHQSRQYCQRAEHLARGGGG